MEGNRSLDELEELEGLKALVRDLRKLDLGVKVDFHGEEASRVMDAGAEVLRVGARSWRVQGTERLRLFESTPKPAKPRAAPAAKEPAKDSEAICDKCGATFVKSRFNPYFTKCPACRRKEKGPAPAARNFTCPECGEPFTISKFQPYLNPDRCPKCSRKAARKDYLSRKKEAKAAGQPQ